MNEITLVIPTRDRVAKLDRCLDSIGKDKINFPFKLVVVCDGCEKTHDKFSNDERVDRLFFIDGHHGSVFCRNYASSRCNDGFSWGVDDVVYEDDFFNRAIESYSKRFPDDDGVLGFNVLNNKHRVRKASQSICGLGLVGKKWLERYPEKKLLYPEYFHFSIQEVATLGTKLNKIYLDMSLKVYHLSPAAGEPADKTHSEARRHRVEDKQLFRERCAQGLVWGG